MLEDALCCYLGSTHSALCCKCSLGVDQPLPRGGRVQKGKCGCSPFWLWEKCVSGGMWGLRGGTGSQQHVVVVVQILEMQQTLMRAKTEEEQKGQGAADARRWNGLRNVAEARTMLRTVFRTASGHKAQVCMGHHET